VLEDNQPTRQVDFSLTVKEGTPKLVRPGLLARLAGAPLSYAFAALDIGVFFWVAGHGSTTDPEILIRFGALDPSRVWQGEWWRLLSTAFLHAGVLHLAANVFFGTPWCVALERALGSARFLALYLASALGASALSLLVGHHLSAGASGAIFGVVGAALALHWRAVGSWRAFLRSRAARFTLGNLVVLVVAGLFLPLDQWAHAGGLLTGAAMTWAFSHPGPQRPLPWLALGAALAALVALAIHPPQRFQALTAVQEALAAGDTALARRLVGVARARNDLDPGALDYYEAHVLLKEGDLEGALAKLRPVAEGPPAVARDAARRTLARVTVLLGERLYQGLDGTPDPERGRGLLAEACRDGDVEGCAALREACRGGDAAACGSVKAEPAERSAP
jgi:membrane associated rhomboid family serine protease